MMKLNFKKIAKNKGVSLIEILFYLSIFVVVSLVSINAMISLTKVLRVATINNELVEGGFVLETIVKTANDSSNASVETENEFILYKSSGEENKFIFSGKDVFLYTDDVLIGKLNPAHIDVNSFGVEVINSPRGKALKTSINFNHKSNPSKTENLHSTVLLQGIY